MKDNKFYINRGETNQYTMTSSVEAPEYIFQEFLSYIDGTELDKSLKTFASIFNDQEDTIRMECFFDCYLREDNVLKELNESNINNIFHNPVDTHGNRRVDYFLNIEFFWIEFDNLNRNDLYSLTFNENIGLEPTTNSVDGLFRMFNYLDFVLEREKVYKRILILRKVV